jgi:SAM-dependent methyltransferase
LAAVPPNPRVLLARARFGAVRRRLIARHYVDAVAPLAVVGAALRGYPRYLRDRRRYLELSATPLDRYDDNPQLHDWTATSPSDAHYTQQDAWAAREIYAFAPPAHVDVGSRVTFVLGLAAFVPTSFVDLRPLTHAVPNLTAVAGSILDLPYEDHELPSLSCLHVAEHIGLGRYGDALDPSGTERAAAELARVLAPNGKLWFSLPVGRYRTNFNAHRVHDPSAVAPMFEGLKLEAFAGVDDCGALRDDVAPEDLASCEWACGFYRFTRPSSERSPVAAEGSALSGADASD